MFLKKMNCRGYRYYSLVKGFRKDSTIKQETVYYIGDLTKLSQQKIGQIEQVILNKGDKDLLRKFRHELYLEGVKVPTYTLDDFKIEEVLDYGDIVTQHKIFETLNIREIINKHTTKGGGVVDVGSLVEIMAINRNSEPLSRNSLHSWYESTVLPLLLKVKPECINKDVLLRALRYLQPENTIPIQKEIYDNIKLKFGVKTEKVYYDLTSSYFEGSTCIIGKRGHSRDHRPDKSQIVIGIVVNQDGILITHSVYEGNTTDVTTIDATITTLKTQFEVDKCLIIADRGLISAKNVGLIESKEYSYILANKRNKTEKNLIIRSKEECVWKNIDETTKLAEIIVENKKYVLLFNEQMNWDNYMNRVKKLSKAEERLNKVYNSIKRGKIKDLNDLIKKTDRKLVSTETTNYYDLEYTENPLSFTYSLNIENLKEAAKYDGYAIFSTNEIELHVDEVLKIYTQRDIVEKAIRTIKSVIDLRPIYVYKEEAVRGHVFICALSYQIRSVMNYILKDNKIEMSIDEAFHILKKLKVVNIILQEDITIVQRAVSTHKGSEQLIEIFNIEKDIL